MIEAEFRERERFVLLSGAAAAAYLTLSGVLTAAGSGLGAAGNRFGETLVVLYLCARLWGHARTLDDRGEHEALAKVGRIGSPIIFVLLVAQIWASSSIHLRLGLGLMPTLHVGAFTRLEWSADIAIFVLFLATAIAVWVEAADTASALLSRAAYTVLGLLGLDLLAAAWGVVSVVPQLRLVAALFVLSLGGTVLVATVRRVERLDEA